MTPALDPWSEVSAARLPAAALEFLAPLRRHDDLLVFRVSDAIWVRWSPPRPEVVRCLLPAPGMTLFVQSRGEWRRFQRRLRSSVQPPDGEGEKIASLLGPAPFEPISPAIAAAPPIALRLVPGGQPSPASALACRIADLAPWADSATTLEIQSVRAARCGGRTLLLGARLPSIPSATRYWGEALLVPLGRRPEPDLPIAILREAVGAAEDELVLLDESGAERILRSAFQRLTRATIRLAIGRGGGP
jgi:hypothetical protein